MTEDQLFDKPGQGGGPQLPTGQYLFKLNRIQRGQAGEYGDTLEWFFETADTTGEVLYEEGEPFIFKGLTSTKTGINQRTQTKAKARAWAEALMGRELEDSEFDGSLAGKLIGKRCRAQIVENEKGYARIDWLKPLAAPAGNGPKPGPGPKPRQEMTPEEALSAG